MKPIKVRYVIRQWGQESFGIFDLIGRCVIGWRSSGRSATERANQLNQIYVAL
jgi:hypothetical protein